MPMLAGPLALGLLTAAWSAGFFWSWSFTVMPGLSAAPPEAAVAAVRAVNANIRGAAFAFVFFGPCVLAALGAAAVHGAGVVAVTVAANLPLNAALAAVPVSPGDAAAVWRDFAEPWTAWNHLRTASATLAFLALAAAAALALRG